MTTVPADIRQLVAAAPSPPNEAIPTGASDEEINAFSARTGVPVPPDLRAWWRFTNAPCVGPGGMYGVRPKREYLDVEEVYRHRPEWRTARWIPIAGDGCGNDYVLTTTGDLGPTPPVIFFEHEQGDPLRVEYVVASGLWPFLRFLLRQELGERGWPFDKAAVLNADPNLIGFVKLPWDA